MSKIKIDSNLAFLYPMPMVLVGALVADKPNFMAVGWVARINYQPPLLGIALSPHYTNEGIEANREFSINIPDVALLEKTDYCGIVSGRKVDKSAVFRVFYGELSKAPLIEECPICMACSLYDAVQLPSNILYIGEPKEVYTEERCMTAGTLDPEKIKPFVLTMPDNHYWALGDQLGKAWSVGKKLKES